MESISTSNKGNKKKRVAQLPCTPSTMDTADNGNTTRSDLTHTSCQSPSPSSTRLATLLAKLLTNPSPKAAHTFLLDHKPNITKQNTTTTTITNAHRKQLAILAGLESTWVNCDQRISSNVQHLSHDVVSELFEPYRFYRQTFSAKPRESFQRRMATPPLSKKGGFWTVPSGSKKSWLEVTPDSTFDAVVHFVQAGSGTGVHVGGGKILTCAHVVDARDDDDNNDDDLLPERRGRLKVVMFASGRTFLAECTSVVETVDGFEDVAVLVLGAEVFVEDDEGGAVGLCLEVGKKRKRKKTRWNPLPSAEIAEDACEAGERLFCIGNPSNVDMESCSRGSGGEGSTSTSTTRGSIEFEPPTFHTSVGTCVGYKNIVAQRKQWEQAGRGRAPTRGELKTVAEAKPAGAQEGGFLQHSCWTYWGHSGAPLFDGQGRVMGLHCAWDDRTGMRHGQKVQHLERCLIQASERQGDGSAGKKEER